MVAQNFDSVIEQLTAIEKTIAGADKSAADHARVESGRILARQRGARKAIPSGLQKRLSTELTITTHTVETRIAAATAAASAAAAAAAAKIVGIPLDGTLGEGVDMPYLEPGNGLSAAEKKARCDAASAEQKTRSAAQKSEPHHEPPDADVPGAEPEPAGAEVDVVVDAEIVEALNEDAARRLTDLIRTGLDETWELIIRAWEGRAWIALGYPNWDSYCDSEFHPGRLRVPREERRDVVMSMREAGMSIRAISATTGTGTRQVQEAITDWQVCSETTPAEVAQPTITGTDGKVYPARKTPEQVAAAMEKRVAAAWIKKRAEAASAKKKAPAADEGATPAPTDTEAPRDPARPWVPTTISPPKTRSRSTGNGKATKKPAPNTEPLMRNFMITINSDGTAAVAVTFMGDEECIVSLAGSLDKQITPAVAADLAYHLKLAAPKIENLIGQLNKRAKAGS